MIFVVWFFSRSPLHRESSLQMNVAVVSTSSLLPQSLVCSWTPVGRTLCLAVCKGGHLCSIIMFGRLVFKTAVMLQVGDGASFIFLYMWALNRSWLVRSLMTTTCCQRSRKWKSSFSMRCPKCVDVRWWSLSDHGDGLYKIPNLRRSYSRSSICQRECLLIVRLFLTYTPAPPLITASVADPSVYIYMQGSMLLLDTALQQRVNIMIKMCSRSCLW